ncbi:iron uptake transporter deferrochelatase/peroxidase subunit [Kribbella solani]|uniref:iron uptake transporter deferrochelatase/peroxidase subunit n=1 Tax=Kribbella solani TaxID=236067 RepID=UPI0029A92CA4|nr:iron uptake transporter deferrochelatase/peroxidase subunit [Kribbella solani]MDX2973913.1 iron uptake transporter deferrochelatase/peroxidase subunit [Kribbella solani]
MTDDKVPTSGGQASDANTVSGVGSAPSSAVAPAQPGRRRGFSRRGLFGAAGAAVATGVAGYAVRSAVAAQPTQAAGNNGPVDFHGVHQAGIVTPVQDRLHFAAFDVTTTSRDDLISLLKEWTAAAALLTAGKDIGQYGAVNGPDEAPPEDTGEAVGLPPARLTLTIGFGPGLFDKRFGLAAKRPKALVDLPHFIADNLDPQRSGGDLAVQACSDDPQVAVHAIRNLARIGFGRVAVRYSQLGFGRTSSTSRAQSTPRNLFGFKDGTNNLKLEEADKLEQQLWVQSEDGPDWMVGGSYLVSRRIRMHIETWDRTSLGEQEAVIGRGKGTGAPLGKADEFDAIDFAAKNADGEPKVPTDSHVRLAHPQFNNGAELLRRGYNFVDGSDGLGRLDAGLFFLAYQRDPRKQFIPIQKQLSRDDKMNEYIEHVGSAVFACPPGVTPGSYWGEKLFS